MGDATDWDYTVTSPDRAWELQAEYSGALGEPVLACIPHGDRCLIIGCRTSLWTLRGDPAFGGKLVRLSSEVGIQDRHAWCHDAEGYLWILTQDGIYIMPPGCGETPYSISREKLPLELFNVDKASYTTSMAYDIKDRGIHLFVTKDSSSTGVGHFWLDTKIKETNDSQSRPGTAFWPVSFPSTNYESYFTYSQKSTTSTKSITLMGCRDGYIRRFDNTVAQDDGTNFDSNVLIGPIPLGQGDFNNGILNSLIADLGTGSGDVTWEVYVGASAEEAFAASARETGTWTGTGRQFRVHPRASGAFAYVKLKNGQNGTEWHIDGLSGDIIHRGRSK
jgi:hypothetical protein